jgi:protein gp37
MRFFDVMALADWHTFQILTKRPVRMFEYFQSVQSRFNLQAGRVWLHDGSKYSGDPCSSFLTEKEWPLPNVWLGVSVENQECADDRIPWVLKTPAAVRFLSVEPLLGPVNLAGYLAHSIYCGNRPMGGSTELWDYSKPCSCEKIHLVIVGGESGPGARPLRPDWVRSIRDQCQARKVNFFFKQWGEFQYCEKIPNSFSWATPDGQLLNFIGRDAEKEGWVLKDAVRFKKAGKKAAGRLLDGKTYDEMPTTQEVTA